MQNTGGLDKKIKELSDQIDKLNNELFELEDQKVKEMTKSLNLKSYIGKFYKDLSNPTDYYKIDDIEYYGEFFNNIKITGTIITFDPGAYLSYVERYNLRKEDLIEIPKEEFVEQFNKVLKLVNL